ncbi:MAG TPA: hypothetical protein VF582_07395 [Allosphingosinicella sp.]
MVKLGLSFSGNERCNDLGSPANAGEAELSVAANYALKAIVRGLSQSGVLNVGQLHSILNELEDAAERLDERGRKHDAAEIREIIEFAFEGRQSADQ